MRRHGLWMKIWFAPLPAQVRSRYWNLKVSYLECNPLSHAACISLAKKLHDFLLSMEGTRLNKKIFGESANRPARADCRMEVSHFVWSAPLPKLRSRYWNLKLPYLDCTPCIVVRYALKVSSSAKSGRRVLHFKKMAEKTEIWWSLARPRTELPSA